MRKALIAWTTPGVLVLLAAVARHHSARCWVAVVVLFTAQKFLPPLPLKRTSPQHLLQLRKQRHRRYPRWTDLDTAAAFCPRPPQTPWVQWVRRTPQPLEVARPMLATLAQPQVASLPCQRHMLLPWVERPLKALLGQKNTQTPWWKSTWFIVSASVGGAGLLAVIGLIMCSWSESSKGVQKKIRAVATRDMALAESSGEAADAGPLLNTSRSEASVASSFPTASSVSAQSVAWDPSMPLFGTPALRVPSLQGFRPAGQ